MRTRVPSDCAKLQTGEQVQQLRPTRCGVLRVNSNRSCIIDEVNVSFVFVKTDVLKEAKELRTRGAKCKNIPGKTSRFDEHAPP